MASASIAIGEGLMSIGKLAKYLGICTRTIKNYERDGKIPGARRNPLNGHRIYTPDDVDRILAIITGVKRPDSRSAGRQKSRKPK